MKLTLTQISTALLDLNEDDLKTLHNELTNLLVHKSTLKQIQAARSLRIGQKVKFFNNKQGTIVGHITKINTKTVELRSEHEQMWKVSPSLLTVVEAV